MSKPRLLLILFSAWFALGASPQSGSWYPRECCPKTCTMIEAPQLKALLKQGGERTITLSTHQKLPVPKKLEARESKDGEYHACIGYDAFGDLEVKCLFVPVTM